MFKFIQSLHKVNNVLHFANVSFFILGAYNYYYFNEDNKTKFTNASFKNSLIILVDSLNHSNINKLYYLFPSIITKTFMLGLYYKLFASRIIKEQYESLFLNKNKNYRLDIKEEKLTERDLFEVEITENESSKLTKLYEINQKQKFGDDKDDELIKFMNKNENLHNNLINVGVAATALSVLI